MFLLGSPVSPEDPHEADRSQCAEKHCPEGWLASRRYWSTAVRRRWVKQARRSTAGEGCS